MIQNEFFKNNTGVCGPLRPGEVQPVQALRCVQTHSGSSGPGQTAVGVQKLAQTSLLTVLHDDEELRVGSCMEVKGQGRFLYVR